MRVFSVILLLLCVFSQVFSSYIVDFPNPVQNDDFCDLKSGVDESLTSACSHLRNKFACPARNGMVVSIPSSRVNDGVCDCCDGSDEKNNSEETTNKKTGARIPSLADSWNVQCPNTCEDGIVSHRNTVVEVIAGAAKKVKNTIDNKMSVKQARRERYENNRPKREAKTERNKRSLYARVKRKLTMVFLYTALCVALLVPLCYCLCCVPAVTNLLEIGMYKLRMLVLFLFQRFGMSSVKTSYTLSKDATNMV